MAEYEDQPQNTLHYYSGKNILKAIYEGDMKNASHMPTQVSNISLMIYNSVEWNKTFRASNKRFKWHLINSSISSVHVSYNIVT